MASVVLTTARRHALPRAVLGLMVVAFGITAATLVSTDAPRALRKGPTLYSVAALGQRVRQGGDREEVVQAEVDRLLNLAERRRWAGWPSNRTVYSVAMVDGVAIVVTTGEPTSAVRLSGTLKPLRGNPAKFAARVASLAPSLASRIAPMYLDASADPMMTSVVWSLIALVLAVGGLLTAGRNVRALLRPGTSGLVRGLKRSGPDAVTEVEATMRSEDVPLVGTLHIGPWIIDQRRAAISALPAAHVCWVYEKKRPLGIFRRRSVVVVPSEGKPLTAPQRNSRRSGLAIDVLRQRCPYAVFGYTTAAAVRWKRDRDQFVAEVTHRRRRGIAGPLVGACAFRCAPSHVTATEAPPSDEASSQIVSAPNSSSALSDPNEPVAVSRQRTPDLPTQPTGWTPLRSEAAWALPGQQTAPTRMGSPRSRAEQPLSERAPTERTEPAREAVDLRETTRARFPVPELVGARSHTSPTHSAGVDLDPWSLPTMSADARTLSGIDWSLPSSGA